MPLVLKLIGQFKDRETYEIIDAYDESIDIDFLINLLTFWGLSSDEIAKIKFITDSEQINNSGKSFPIKDNEDRIIFVFTSDIELRIKLTIFFNKKCCEINQTDDNEAPHAYKVLPDPELCKPNTMKEQYSVPKLTNELIDSMNVKSVSLFADKDFKSLISIYLRRPELFGIMANYVQNGNIIEESLDHVKTIDKLTDEEMKHYENLADKINHFQLGITNEVIINKLIKFSGHLNLTLRSILCDIANNST
jgi:hypothetical protein